MPPRNALLAKVSRAEFEVIAPDLEPVRLVLKPTLHEPLERIGHVYFVERGVGSMVNEADSGEVVEFATIGPEGMIGFPVLLGAEAAPSRAMVQIPGEALRMRASELRRALPRTPDFYRVPPPDPGRRFGRTLSSDRPGRSAANLPSETAGPIVRAQPARGLA